MGIILEEEQKGFTIIEVMLFLALTGFLLAGILVGAGSSIANQRYKDAVQDAADVLRKAYSFVADTQIETRDGKESACNYTKLKDGEEIGRGRTSCSVYGAVVTINGATIQTTTLLGKDLHDIMLAKDNAGEGGDCSNPNDDSDYCKVINNIDTTDTAVLNALKVNNLVQVDGNKTFVAGNSSTQKLKWGAFFKKAYKKGEGEGDDDPAQLTLLIYRSPRDGSIRTMVMDDIIRIDKTGGEAVDYNHISQSADARTYGVGKYFEKEPDGSDSKFFVPKDVYICVDSGGAESYADHSRMIRIIKNSHSQSGIKLEDLDGEVKDAKGNTIVCEKD